MIHLTPSHTGHLFTISGQCDVCETLIKKIDSQVGMVAMMQSSYCFLKYICSQRQKANNVPQAWNSSFANTSIGKSQSLGIFLRGTQAKTWINTGHGLLDFCVIQGQMHVCIMVT